MILEKKIRSKMKVNRPESSSIKKFIFLDAFRGLCALCVLFSHSRNTIGGSPKAGILSKQDNVFRSIIGSFGIYSTTIQINLSSLLKNLI
jgi:peptidoglycan/LPS O-acetylase OafA/YrhL